jgi:glycosyltransferase involved in cell wall biosynthesis
MSLRALHVLATMNRRGAEVFASDLVRALASQGVEQQVAVLHPSNGPGRVSFEAPTLVVGDGWTTPGLRMSLEAVWSLRRLVSRWRPDVVQAHGGEPFKYLVISGAGDRSKLVYRRIGAAPQWIRQGPRRLVHAALMRRAAEVVAVAEAVRRETLEVFGVPPTKVRMIPNGVDPGRLKLVRGRQATRKALGIAPDAHIMLSVGALTWEKDPLAHLDVAEQVAANDAELVHLIVGDGPMRQEVIRAVRRRGLQDRVKVMGSRTDVPDLLAASDVVLFASRPDGMEGMPAVLIEAGMIGVPVVGYEIVGASEVVAHNATGLLSPYGDVEAVASNVLRLLRDSQMRRSMGRAAQAHCRSSFDIQVVASEYLATYQRLSEA